MSFWKRNWGDPAGKYLEVDAEETASSCEVKKAEPPRGACVREPASREPAIFEQRDDLTKRFGKLRSALGEGTIINGKLSFDAPVRIDGRLKGEVFSSQALIVGEKGEVEAEISVASLIVLGAVKGNVKASQRVELFSGARLEGEVQTPVLAVAEGSFFSAKCRVAAANKVVNVVVDGDNLSESAAQVGQKLDQQKSNDSDKENKDKTAARATSKPTVP